MKKVIMIGMNPRTRSLIPWDTDAEFWTLNEGYSKDWMKRYDVLFQIHKRWDWDRPNNPADPNHPLYIKQQAGECLYCKGKGIVFKGEVEVNCPFCTFGQYVVPEHRNRKRVIMQDDNEDVPGCIHYPIETIMEKMKLAFPYEAVYLTSTLAHMLAYAIAYLPDIQIELYGFEAESNTEYAVQRPCIEYLIGYGRGLGMSIEAPGSHLLTGKQYAYEDVDQGFRSRIELRRKSLQEQLNAAEIEAVKSEGYLDALTQFKKVKAITPAWEQAFDDHYRRKQFVSFLRGTLKELNHGIEIFDAHRQDLDDATDANMLALIETRYTLG